jgi:hypothetical protein
MKLRIFRRWEPFIDPNDPGVGWTTLEVLQVLQGEEWIDVPIVDEGSLTEEIKQERLPSDQKWRLRY